MRLKSLAFTSVGLLLLGGCEKNPAPGKETARPGGPAGQVASVLSVGQLKSSGIQIRTGDTKGKWAAHRVGQVVNYGAGLRTSTGARARFVFSAGDVINLDEETDVQLLGKDRLKVSSGSVLAVVAPRTRGSALVLETPAGTVRVTGTKVHLTVQKATTTVDVTRGSVEVQGAGTRVAVGAGERALVRKGGAPRVSLSRDLERITRWAREVRPPSGAAHTSQRGFGSLRARVPGRGKSHALRLASHKVRVIVRDNVARTEIEQSWYNSSGQTLEGTFSFPLPADATISRLALYVGKRLEEGEIVERRRARQIFRQIVEDTIRPRDPALLEWMGGRQFRMKIFPLPPRSARRVILAYTQPLEASYGRYRYVYPMSTSKAKSTRVGRFSLQMKVHNSLGLGQVVTPLYPVVQSREPGNKSTSLRYEASDFAPAASFIAEITPVTEPPEMQLALYERKNSAGCALRRALSGSRARKLAGTDPCGDRGGFFMAVLRPELPTTRRAGPRDLLFLMDSSRSTGKQGWALQGAALEAFLAEMDLRSRFSVMACDATCKSWRRTPARPTGRHRKAALAFVRGLVPGGSSNIQESFREAAGVAAAMGRGVRVIYMGDGKPTAGELREPQLAKLVVQRLRKAGAQLSVLQVGDDASTLFLNAATRQLSGAVHPINPGDDVASRVFEMVAAQYRPTLTGLKVAFEGVKVHHVYPGTLPSLTAGSEVVLVGRYDAGGEGAIVLSGRVGERDFSRRYPVKLQAGVGQRQANAFIPRFWAQQHLDALTLDGYDRNRAEIVRVSKAYTVMSRATAFLVLENERMYREFGVKRKRRRDYWKGDKVATSTSRSKSLPQKNAAPGRARAKTAAPRPTPKPAAQPAAGPGLASGLGGSAGSDKSKLSLTTSPARRNKGADRRGAPADEDGDEMERREAEKSEEARPRSAPATPAAEPAPDMTARPSTRPRPKKRAPPRASRRSRAKPRSSGGDMMDPFYGGGGYRHRPRPYYVTVRRARIEPLLAVSSSKRQLSTEARLQRMVAAYPLRRAYRRALHRSLVLSGQYDRALLHARKWASLDASHAHALRALADMLAATGQSAAAARSYSATVEVRPYSSRQHRYLAQMYRNKGDLNRSCSHIWSILSLRPSAVSRHLQLARCLAQIPARRAQALQLLTELSATPLGRRHAANIGRTLASIQATPAVASRPALSTRGALVVAATWSRAVDLDLALVTPRGERISALQGGRHGQVKVDSRDGRSAEVLRLRWAPSGSYRVEIARPSGNTGPISGTILVRAHGKSRTIPFNLAGPSSPLARVLLTTQRVRRYR